MFQSYLNSPVIDLCKNIPFDEIESEYGVESVCKNWHKKAALTIVNNDYSDFQHLLSTSRGCNEIFKALNLVLQVP